MIDDAQYYGYDNLPLGYQQVVVDGITYYLFDGVYYQPYIYGGQTVYMVVPNPNLTGKATDTRLSGSIYDTKHGANTAIHLISPFLAIQ